MWKSAAPWLSLAVLLAVFLLFQHRMKFAGDFGFYHDDTVYFSSAGALAEGRGYIIPSLPGSPAQTKYPPFYSWLLSWVWRSNTRFPDNVALAVWVSALFGCGFLVAAFQFLRQLRGVGPWPALFLVALCAFHPIFFYLGGLVLSDLPFAALALGATVAADAALREKSRPLLLIVAGILAGLSVMTRTFGLAVIAGLVATALLRRRPGRALGLSLIAAPFAALSLWWSATATNTTAGAEAGFRQTWLFYTSYGEFWNLSVPTAEVFFAMVGANLRYLLQHPASYCLFPPLGEGASYTGILLSVTLSAAILNGIVRQARSQEWKPIHLIFLFYIPIVLVWNYSLMDRFLILFLPLFYAGLWIEGKWQIAMVRRSFQAGRPLGEKVVAGLLAAGLLAVAGLAVRQYVRSLPRRSADEIARRATRAAEKAEIYAWIREKTDPSTRFIAYQDVLLYLHTGRQAMRPIVFSTAAFYMKDENILERDLAHITDVARHIGARYWVMAEDDFHQETGLPLIEKKMAEVRKALPVVFRSRHDRVQIYDLSSLIGERVDLFRHPVLVGHPHAPVTAGVVHHTVSVAGSAQLAD